MSNRLHYIYGGILLALVATQIGVLFYAKRQARSATLVLQATNAGVPLASEDARVFVHPAGRYDEVAAEGDLGESLRAPAGIYDVRVAYTRSRDGQEAWLRGVEIPEGQSVLKDVVFSAGELSVAADAGSEEGEEGEVVVYVFSAGDPDRVIATLRSSERGLLAAGIYNLRAVLTVSSEEKDVRWLRDVPVEPGLHTSRALAFRRGTLLVRATNAGKHLPAGAVEVSVFRAGDPQEEEIERGLAGVPLGLPVRTYDVRATFSASSDRPARWLKNVEIRDRQLAQENIAFSSGTILVKAEMAGEPLGPFDAYIYYYTAGDHTVPVAYTPAAEPAVLSAGIYELRASFYRSHDRPDLWERSIQVEGGSVLEKTVSFPSGRLLVRAYDGEGKELVGDNIFVYIHAQGQGTRSIAAARSGEEMVLTEGIYDIRAMDTRNPAGELWITGVHLRAGARRKESVTFLDSPRKP